MKRILAFLLAFSMCFVFIGTYGFEDVCTDHDCAAHALHADGPSDIGDDALYAAKPTSAYTKATGILEITIKIGLQSEANETTPTAKVKGGKLEITVSPDNGLSNLTVVEGLSYLFGKTITGTDYVINGSKVTFTIPDSGELVTGSGLIRLTMKADETYFSISSALRIKNIVIDGQTTSGDDRAILFDSDASVYPIYVCDHANTSERIKQAATCGKIGKKEVFCEDCGCVISSVDLLPTGIHTYDMTNPLKVYTAATCTVAGLGQFKCSVCGAYASLPIPATGHTLGKSYQRDGIWYQKCSVCGIETLATNQCQHDRTAYVFTKIVTASTCEAKGIGLYTCPTCGLSEERELPLAAHTPNTEAYQTTLASTCTATGLRKTICTVCGQEIVETMPVLGHDFGDWGVTKAPTCLLAGTEEHTCSRCGETDTRTVAALGHSFGAWITVTPPSCETPGTEQRTCSVCGTKDEKTTVADGHDFGIWVLTTAPTCSAQGEETHTCFICGEKETRAVAIVPNNHSFGEWTAVTARTCLKDGLKERVCIYCGKKETMVDSCIGHQFGPAVVDGKTTAKSCSICGYKVTTTTLKNGTEKVLQSLAGKLTLSGTAAANDYIFNFEAMSIEKSEYYRQYLTFEQAYTYTITVGETVVSPTEEMSFAVTLDNTLEEYDVKVVALKNNAFYPITFTRKGQTVAVAGEDLIGADSIFVIKGEKESAGIVLPIVIVGVTLAIAGVALYFILNKNKHRGNSF